MEYGFYRTENKRKETVCLRDNICNEKDIGRLCLKCDSNLAITAIERAIEVHGQPYMIMTDRGSQFTSKAFYDIMQEKNIKHSMSRPHTPTDNRYIETFWKTMKTEIGKTSHLTPTLYRLVIDYYINYYNTLRPHSSLNYLTPLEYNLKTVI